jgi:hypothetical protein
MDDVEQQLFARFSSVLSGGSLGGLGARDDNSAEWFAGFAQRERKDVGGRVVAQELAVQPGDGAVVDEGDFNVGPRHALGAQNMADCLADEAVVESQKSLAVGNLDRDHADFGSGYLTRP